MNLITAFNGFTDWEDTNDLSDVARNLYITLLQYANRAGWPDELSIPTIKLIARTPGIKEGDRKTLGNYRDELEREGLIEWRSRKGRQSAVYKIVDLCRKFDPNLETQTATQTETQTATQPSTQTTTIYRTNNKNKKDIKDDDNNVSVGTGFGELLTEDEINTGKQKEVDLDALYSFFQSCDPGISSDYDRTRLRVLLDEGYTKAEIHNAIKQSADNKAVKWPYITKVLTSKRGEKGEFLRPDAGHKQQGQRGNQSSPASEWGDLDTINL